MRQLFKGFIALLMMIISAAAMVISVSADDKVYGGGEMNSATMSTLLADVNSVIMLPIIVILTVLLQMLILKKVTKLKNTNFICLTSVIATLGSYIISVMFSLVVFKINGGSFGIFELGASGMFRLFSASNLLIGFLVTVPVLYYGLKQSYRSKRRHEISGSRHKSHHHHHHHYHHSSESEPVSEPETAAKEATETAAVKDTKVKSPLVQNLTKYKKLKLAILYTVIATAALNFVIQLLLDLVSKR